MIECPKCSGLNPIGAAVCGNCGASLESVNNNSNNINSTNDNDGIVLYEKEVFNNNSEDKIKNKHIAIGGGDVLLFVLALASFILVPIRLLKLCLAFVFFYIAESSNRNGSIFLVLVRIITAIQIFGVVIALILRIFAPTDILVKYFQYFKF